jgi:trk system potassium uptake protein TrkA
MKIGILGAGTLGRFLARTFCNDKHDVTVIDTSSATLSRIRDKFDVMTVIGDGAKFETLLQAKTSSFDMFIAVGTHDTINMHACRIARHMGVPNVICRLVNKEYFSIENDFAPDKIGIDHVVVPEEECAKKIIDVLDNSATLEKITFSVPDALITAFSILPNSPLDKVKLSAFPEPEMIRSVRFAAIVRNGKLFAPHGETELLEDDEIYLAGKKKEVEAMVEWAIPVKQKMKRIILAGGTKLASLLAAGLSSNGYDIRLVEKSRTNAERILAELDTNLIVINGDPSEGDILEEAGVSTCDAFIAIGDDDEDNILSCILAKRMGAKKVITLTNKEEYVDLVCKMDIVDCGFSRWLVAGNSILKYISTINQVHTNAMLHRTTNAFVSEFDVKDSSAVCNKQIDKCKIPASAVLSLVFRKDEVLIPAGDLTLEPGDLVAAITTPESEKKLGKLFN